MVGINTNAMSRGRRDSGALMEQRAPDWVQENAVLRRVHEFVYPSDSNWYWYRRGKVSHSSLSRKQVKFWGFNVLMACASSGYIFPLAYLCFTAFLRVLYEVGVQHEPARMPTEWLSGLNFSNLVHPDAATPEWYSLASKWWYVLAQCTGSGLLTMGMYILGGELLLKEFYTDRAGETEQWKCQPTSFLTPERAWEEKWLGCANAFFAGVYGTGLFILHVNYPFFKFYYEVDSLAYMFASALACYLWIDFYSYLMHKALHTKWLYKNVHKIHHRYTCPTPYSAFALHPLEMVLFQSAGIFPCFLFPIHVAVYLCVVLFIAIHNQIDHSGVDIEGDFPWTPSAKFHDDHHKYFHVNFGVHLVLWDYLFATLRSKNREYGEDKFVGEQDVAGGEGKKHS